MALVASFVLILFGFSTASFGQAAQSLKTLTACNGVSGLPLIVTLDKVVADLHAQQADFGQKSDAYLAACKAQAEDFSQTGPKMDAYHVAVKNYNEALAKYSPSVTNYLNLGNRAIYGLEMLGDKDCSKSLYGVGNVKPFAEKLSVDMKACPLSRDNENIWLKALRATCQNPFCQKVFRP